MARGGGVPGMQGGKVSTGLLAVIVLLVALIIGLILSAIISDLDNLWREVRQLRGEQDSAKRAVEGRR